jgi:hypothetical protein
VGLERSGSAARLPEKSPEKKSANRIFHLYGELQPPSDHYELWSTWWSCRRNELLKFCFDRLTVFVLRGAETGNFLYLATAVHKTQYRALPRLQVISTLPQLHVSVSHFGSHLNCIDVI